MMCQKCGKRAATTHIRRNINGTVSEMHLCGECARQENLTPIFSGLMPDFADFWGNLFGDALSPAIGDGVRCEGCGHSFRDIVDSGKVGCAKCYTTFYNQLLPSIQRIHGRTAHTGRTLPATDEQTRRKAEIESLKATLQREAAAQNYEECARLRDQIKQLEQQKEA